jgi:hypothetical protein
MTTNPIPNPTDLPVDLHALPREVIRDVPLVNGFRVEVKV